MPSSPTTWSVFIAGAFAAATLAVVGPLTATPAPDARKAFRRPATLGDRTVNNNAAWKLGRRLFFDTHLSGSDKTSCATCHQASKAWGDTHPLAIGDNGQHLAFKAPTLLNVGWLSRLGWTGRFADTASVSLFAMGSAATMNMPLANLVERLRADPTYVAEFRHAFPQHTIDGDEVGVAITTYVNSISSAKGPFDRWVEGDDKAIGPAAKRGFAIFNGKGHCAECHSGWTFTDGSFHDIGSTENDPGRGKYFKTSIKLQHAFKTPSLRGVAERAPYMHDGSKASLEEVIDLYDRGGIARASRAEPIRPLGLTAEDKADLKAFLLTLSGGTEFAIHD